MRYMRKRYGIVAESVMHNVRLRQQIGSRQFCRDNFGVPSMFAGVPDAWHGNRTVMSLGFFLGDES